MDTEIHVKVSNEKAALLGHPSYVWRFGQDRRLGLIRQWAPLEGRRVLDVGCGLGMYMRKMRAFSPHVYGVEIDLERAIEAGHALSLVAAAAAEALPFPDASFDVILSHEMIEHVRDDRRSIAEAVRVLRPGGRLVLFCPNRLYFFETHGHYWRGRYHEGNTPLINWLPDPLRHRLAPHVRAYTRARLRRLFDGLPVRIVFHTQIYPGYDNIAYRWPRIGRLLRRITYALERTPLRVFGLSHFLVAERL
ncbi:MAG: class I SAM-dependent methyltransferase [Anaerolineae bacterium]|nr:class I SAM-dependent methyltransferase [Anaerolineae bacterium]MDW8099875.1 class I SAM-dependent methyltransferase [Anaerolineae bacterium]